jgi:hypothetical protein
VFTRFPLVILSAAKDLPLPLKRLRHLLTSSPRITVAAFPLLALLLICIGCAVPGEPLPPLLEIPAPVTALVAQQVGSQLQIKFPVPQLTTQGTLPQRMERIDLFIVYTSPTDGAPDFSAQPAKTWTRNDFGSGGSPDELTYSQPLSTSKIGQRAWLAVRVANHRNVDAGLSNVVSVDVVNLPEAPRDLTAKVSEQAVDIAWTASARSIFGGSSAPSPETQYEIFREVVSSATPMESIGKPKSPSFTDSTIQLGNTYRYAVRAFVASEDSVGVTPLSPALEVAATDRFAPAAPANLRAIPVTGVVELAWTPNAEPDLEGYNVYRTRLGEDGSGAAREKLNPAPLDISLYRDESAQPGSRYSYKVTALDGSGNESPPSNEELVETE